LALLGRANNVRAGRDLEEDDVRPTHLRQVVYGVLAAAGLVGTW
jgi:hypothetical protein